MTYPPKILEGQIVIFHKHFLFFSKAFVKNNNHFANFCTKIDQELQTNAS
jgi:hypothetical protein